MEFSGSQREGLFAKEELEEYLEELLGKGKNRPGLFVVDSAAGLPFPAPADVPAAIFRGGMYVVASRVRDAAHARKIVAHEVIGHYGLHGFFGAALHDALDLVHKHNLLVREYAENWKKSNIDVIRIFKLDHDQIHYLAIEEALAELAEEERRFTLSARLARVMQTLLRRAGLERWANRLEMKTDAEALQILRKAELFVKRGYSVATAIPDPLYPLFVRGGRKRRRRTETGRTTWKREGRG